MWFLLRAAVYPTPWYSYKQEALDRHEVMRAFHEVAG